MIAAINDCRTSRKLCQGRSYCYNGFMAMCLMIMVVLNVTQNKEAEAKPAMLGFEKSFRDEVSTGGELGNFIDLQEAPRILQRRSYGNRRNAYPCRWKLCGAYNNYSNYRRFF